MKSRTASKRLARLTPEEDRVWTVYFNWFTENRKDNRPSRADKYAWDMLLIEFPRLRKYDGALP